jgi:hypothetical protein
MSFLVRFDDQAPDYAAPDLKTKRRWQPVRRSLRQPERAASSRPRRSRGLSELQHQLRFSFPGYRLCQCSHHRQLRTGRVEARLIPIECHWARLRVKQITGDVACRTSQGSDARSRSNRIVSPSSHDAAGKQTLDNPALKSRREARRPLPSGHGGISAPGACWFSAARDYCRT